MRFSENTRRVLTLSSLFLVVLFKFQNCGPSQTSLANTSLNYSADSQVRIVDRWHESQLTFLTEAQKVTPAQAEVFVRGLCVGFDNEQKIEYQIIALQALPKLVSNGVVDCTGGGFELQLSTSVIFENCTDQVQIRAARVGQSDEVAETILTPDCTTFGG